jgi:hypothetical protein
MNDIVGVVSQLVGARSATVLPSTDLDLLDDSRGAPSSSRYLSDAPGELRAGSFTVVMERTGTRVRVRENRRRPMRALVASGPNTDVRPINHLEASLAVPEVGDAVLLLSTDRGILLERTDSGLRIHPLRFSWGFTTQAQVEEWLGGCPIGWLRHEVQQLLMQDDEWDALTAAALLARLSGYRHDDLGVSVLMNVTRLSPVIGGPIEWVREADDAIALHMRAMMLQHADALASELLALDDADAFRPYDDDWQRAFLDCRRERAVLEALSWLYGQRTRDDGLRQTLRAVDMAGLRALSESAQNGGTDALLRSFALSHPFAWWVATP